MEERRAFNLEMAQQIGRIEGKLDSLCGDQGRITKIEEAQERAETRRWIHTAVILPIVSVAHIIAHKLGI